MGLGCVFESHKTVIILLAHLRFRTKLGPDLATDEFARGHRPDRSPSNDRICFELGIIFLQSFLLIRHYGHGIRSQ